MNILFYVAAVIAVLATAMVITRTNVIHALLYLIVSLLAVALVFFVLGAPLIAALEVILYAGAIMVLFVFVVMMLNLGPQSAWQERQWMSTRTWMGPAVLAAILLAELVYGLGALGTALPGTTAVPPEQVGARLFGPYLLGVELASILLLAGLVGAYHLARQRAASEGEPSREPKTPLQHHEGGLTHG